MWQIRTLFTLQCGNAPANRGNAITAGLLRQSIVPLMAEQLGTNWVRPTGFPHQMRKLVELELPFRSRIPPLFTQDLLRMKLQMNSTACTNPPIMEIIGRS